MFGFVVDAPTVVVGSVLTGDDTTADFVVKFVVFVVVAVAVVVGVPLELERYRVIDFCCCLVLFLALTVLGLLLLVEVLLVVVVVLVVVVFVLHCLVVDDDDEVDEEEVGVDAEDILLFRGERRIKDVDLDEGLSGGVAEELGGSSSGTEVLRFVFSPGDVRSMRIEPANFFIFRYSARVPLRRLRSFFVFVLSID